MNHYQVKKAHKGRGAASNREGRFEAREELAFDDGWGSLDQIEPRPKTQVREDSIRSIITKNQSPDIPFEQSINPYRGCEHGCIYCYARQSHSYLGLSPGLDFETKLFKKSQGPRLLEQTLRKKTYRCRPITLGSNTDPYQPIEKTYRITRQLLEILVAFRHPVAVITKSALILRDLDLLKQLARDRLLLTIVSVTTLELDLWRKMEPRTAAPHRRLEVIQGLSQAGIPVAVNAAPMIPALNDMELEQILTRSAQAGARSAAYILIRLPFEVADLFKEWLAIHYPQKAKHVMSLIRQTRGGEDYRSRFGERMKGQGHYAQLLKQRFGRCCRELGLNHRSFELNREAFRPPPQEGDQLSLFDL